MEVIRLVFQAYFTSERSTSVAVYSTARSNPHDPTGGLIMKIRSTDIGNDVVMTTGRIGRAFEIEPVPTE